MRLLTSYSALLAEVFLVRYVYLLTIVCIVLIFPAKATEEDHSDDGDDDISVNDDSETETTEPDTEALTVASSADSTRAPSPVPPAQYQEQLHPAPSAETTPQKGRASHVAASRGLSVNVAGVDQRRARAPGLPVSPRPIGYSPMSTPTSGAQANASPIHTPR